MDGRQTTGSMIFDNRKYESSLFDTSRIKSESESFSFSSEINTDEEEECLNGILDAIDRCNMKRTQSKNRFDVRLWRKLCLEEEQKLKLRKMNTFNIEPEMITLSPNPKEIKKVLKPRRSSKAANKFHKLNESSGTSKRNFDKQRSIKTEESKSYSAIVKRSLSPTPTPVNEYSEHSSESK